MAEETSPEPEPSSNLPALRPQGVFQEEESYQQNASGRITALPLALGLIALGLLLLLQEQVEGFTVTLPVAALILIAALVLTNLFRFFASGRRERGLFFLALMALALGGMLALVSLAGETFQPVEWWPLTLIGTAGALLVTFIFEREHERGLLGLAILTLAAGGVALLVTLGTVPQELTDQTAKYFPLAIAFIGITLIPMALRRE